MQYKTISLEILQQNAKLHEQLQTEQKLLSATNAIAELLKQRQESLEAHLSHAQPSLDSIQRRSASLEMATHELESRLRLVFPPDATEPYRLHAGMAILRSHTSPD